MPPCLDQSCPDHTELKIKLPQVDIPKKPPQKKRKNVKNNADDFVFPNKTARPTTPTPVLQPIDVQNSFTDLVQDPDLPTDNSVEIPKIPPPLPVYLKVNNNYRKQLDQLKCTGILPVTLNVPKFPKPKNGYPITNRNKKVFTSNNVVEGISFANMVTGKTKNSDPQPTNTNRPIPERQSHPNPPPSDETNSSDFQDIISLFKIVSNIFKQFPKLKQIIPDLKKTNDFKKQACMLLEALWD
ncbi:uncharacterized protein TNCV_262111 [Trichonephila clavipes]|nr:uncharacterized protein TNCV_262111 [Trichonephila clavipes]